ncbi:MAG: S-methyl-5-thioribose-1-phosphate isomerase [Candidatus Omnitrophica bacterium]|nr:S-methyl-5-thioribose-1-phosphate isomerase [Candidatus Omnitrophota bacterium]
MAVQTIRWTGNAVRIIDQTRLPNKLVYINCRDVDTLWHAIKELKVRGAPALGVAAAYGVLLGLKDFKGSSSAQLVGRVCEVCDYIGKSRPTAVNLFNSLSQMQALALNNVDKPVAILKAVLWAEANAIYEEDRAVCRAMGKHGATLIKNGMTVMTVCNAGGLATADYGTALGVMYAAKEAGKKFKVYALETRPLLQGARLTAWELMKNKIDVTLICDNMAATVMKTKGVDIIFTGADRIASNGDAANKIGTYMLAVLAQHHGVPFYVVAPKTTFDLKIKTGKEIPIEERKPEEVTSFGLRPTAPKGVKVFNPAFDVTPSGLMSGIVTEYGIIRAPYVKNIHKVLLYDA